MSPEEQVRVAERLQTLVSQRRNDNRGIPTEIDPRRYNHLPQWQREVDELVGAFPLLAGLSSDLPQRGSVLVRDWLPRSLLLVRDESEQLRAFVNACRHRGARIVGEGDKCSQRKRLTCPFHGWSYGLDGRLQGLPDAESFKDVDVNSLGLVELPAAERNGMLWVLPRTGTQAELDNYLDALCPDFKHYGLGQAMHFHSSTIAGAFNWKLGLDTFLEAYHFAALHRNTIANVFRPNLSTFDHYGFGTRGVIARRTFVESSALLLPQCAAIYVLFPNTVFFWQGDHFEIWRVFPADHVGGCIIHFSLYAPSPIEGESARKHWQANVDLALSVVQAEDFTVAAGIQRNLSGGNLPSFHIGANEPGLVWFHACIARALAGQGAPADFDQAWASLARSA
jgi:phenylpropionate dioxygenase-like ring-hydroxylating dioxygenase large terminal subunit